jgi:uncharacterized protein YjiS (DUF1127 family)
MYLLYLLSITSMNMSIAMRTEDWMQTNGSAARTGFGGRWRQELMGWAIRAVEALLAWQTRAAERGQLAAMDDRLLRDVGLSRSDVESERSKPFWTA